MNRSIANALKAVLVLVCISVMCVGMLALCNAFFPKYVPTLDEATAGLINEVCPTGVDNDRAFSEGYIVMLDASRFGADIETFNKTNKSKKATVLAVYAEEKGDNKGAFVLETSAQGRDGEIVLLVAYLSGKIVGATVKKQGESYWEKLPDTVFESIKGESGEVDLLGTVGKVGATISLTAIERAVNLSTAFATEYGNAIATSLETDKEANA